MKHITIAGQGITKFGELWNKDIRQLAIEAAIGAIEDSKLNKKQIDALLVSNMNASMFSGQLHLGALIADELGINCPSSHIEGVCASGSLAINNAYLSLLSGKYKNVLVLGAEKMSDISSAQNSRGLAGASDEEWEAFYGVIFPSLYAMIAREYFRKYNVTEKDLALVSVKNHFNATKNPNAHFPRAVTVESVMESAIVADPLKLLDCSPISDGAAAIILSTEKNKYGIELVASEVAMDTLSLHDREEITQLESTVRASRKAYEEAKISPDDINIAEVHDCFSIAEVLAYEDLGFAKRGEGILQLRKGQFDLTGKLPVNTSGGLKACGHPVGATGVKQAIEVVTQLSGKAGKRQVSNNPKYGLTHNVGGSGATCVINIFKNQ